MSVIPGVPSLHYASLSGKMPDFMRKPMTRAVRRVQDLAKFFDSDRMSAATTALCEITGKTGDRNVGVFSDVNVAGGRYALHTRRSLDSIGTACDFAEINLVTGPCIFSSRVVRFLDEDGGSTALIDPNSKVPSKRLCKLSVESDFALYEYESVIRLTSFIGNLAACLPVNVPLSITIDVPRVQYYMYLMGAFGRDIAGQDLVLEWFNLVDKRNNFITEFIRAQLDAVLVSTTNTQEITIQPATAFGELAETMRESVAAKRIPAVSKLTGILREIDPMWRNVLLVWSPRDFTELNAASYVVEELRASLTGAKDKAKLGIVIENYSEWKIYSSALRVAKRLKRGQDNLEFNLLGMYPLERLHVGGSSRGRTALYFQDPGRHALAPDSKLVDLFDVIRSWHGLEGKQ